jgi:enoyl-CoA hydratase/carnithine racemase
MGLVGACDVVLAVRGATFAMPEARVGLFPMIIVAHLSRSLPRKLLLEMMFTGDPIDADEGHRVGFVNRVYEDRAALDAGLDEYAARFAKVGPDAVRIGRQAFTLLADMPAPQALAAAQFLNVPFFLGDELQEGANAFLERRRPSWAEEDRS